MTKVKVLFLDHAPYEGGAEVSLKQLVVSLNRSIYEPIVLAPGDAPYITSIKRRGIKCVPFQYHWRDYRYLVKCGLDVWRICRLIRHERPDIVHANTRVTTILAGTLALLKRWGGLLPRDLVIINHVRDKDPLPRWKGWVIKQADWLIANSQQVKQFLVESGAPSGRVQVIYNGIDLAQFNPAPEGDAKLASRLTFIGQIYPRKGLNYLLAAVAKLKQAYPQSVLQIAGQDPTSDQRYLKEYQQLSRRLGITDRVQWLGYYEDIVALLSRTSILVLPALEEPFGRVLIEAMAMKVPVVATQGGGIPEVVVEGQTGLLVPSANSAELARAIQRLLDDQELRRRFGQRGREVVEAKFTLKHHVDAITSVYNRLLAKSL